MRKYIKNFALLLDGKGNAQQVSNCTTFTDLQIVEFATEKELTNYATTNKLVIESPDNDTTSA